MIKGSLKTDAVSNSSAVPLSSQPKVGLRAGSGHHYRWLPQKGAVAFGAGLPETSICCFKVSPLIKIFALDFFQSKALNIDN